MDEVEQAEELRELRQRYSVLAASVKSALPDHLAAKVEVDSHQSALAALRELEEYLDQTREALERLAAQNSALLESQSQMVGEADGEANPQAPKGASRRLLAQNRALGALLGTLKRCAQLKAVDLNNFLG